MMKREKGAVINLRVNSETLALIDRAAEVTGTTRSALIRSRSVQEATRVLREAQGLQDVPRPTTPREQG